MPLKDTVSPDTESVTAENSRDRQAMLTALRQRIRHLDPGIVWRQGRENPVVVPLGVSPLDEHLPGGGLFPHALHEIVAGAGPENQSNHAAATGFAAFMLARLSKHDRQMPAPVLWCRQQTNKSRELYVPGLAAYGMSHDQLLMAQGLSAQEVLWAMEEGLASGALGAVIGEPDTLEPVALRRLQLAAESGQTTALLLSTERALPTSTPAYTRWRVTPHTLSNPMPHAAAAMFDWRVELVKCRGGRPATWQLNAADFACTSLIPKPLEHLPHDNNTGTHTGIRASRGRTAGAVSLVAGVRHRPIPQTPAASTSTQQHLCHTG